MGKHNLNGDFFKGQGYEQKKETPVFPGFRSFRT